MDAGARRSSLTCPARLLAALAVALVVLTILPGAPALGTGEAPTVTLGPDASWDEDDAPMALGPATLADGDADLADHSLIVDVIANGDATDQLTIVAGANITVADAAVSFGGTPIGTIRHNGADGSPLQVDFTGDDATRAAVEALLNQLRYARVGATESVRVTIRATVRPTTPRDDTSDEQGSDEINVTVTADDDPHTIAIPGPLAMSENDIPTLLAAAATFHDTDVNYNGGRITMTVVDGVAASDRLYVGRGGAITVWGNEVRYHDRRIGWMSVFGQGTDFVLDFDTNDASPTAIQAMLRQLTVESVSDDPPANRTVQVTVRSPAGVDVSDTIVVGIRPVNDAPRLLNGARTVRMLFIGNSFTFQYDHSVPEYMEWIAAADAARGHQLIWKSRNVDGSTIQDHYANEVHQRPPDDRTRVRSGEWDHVSLQGQSMEALHLPPYYRDEHDIHGRPRFAEHMSLFLDDCRTSGAMAVQFITWPWRGDHYFFEYQQYPDKQPEEPWSGGTQRRWQDQCNEGYRTGRNGHQRVLQAGCGEAFLAFQAAWPDARIYKDDSHPNAVGRYLAACVVYETVFGVSTIGIRHDLTDERISDLNRDRCHRIATRITGAPPSKPTPLTLREVRENDADNPGTTVDELLASAGDAVIITDADADARRGIAVTATDATNGRWEYATDGRTWLPLDPACESSARLLAEDGRTRLRFVPGPGFRGTIPGAITFRAWDQTTGTNGGTLDTGGNHNGGSSSVSAETRVASITVAGSGG